MVIVAGTGLWSGLFEEMKAALAKTLPSEKIAVVPVSPLDWLGFPPSPERSTTRVMKRLHETVARMEQTFPNEDISLVAHSGGGTVALIYLMRQAFMGDVYPKTNVKKLLTLGTPFQSVERYGKLKSDFIAATLKKEFFEQVAVVSIVSKMREGKINGSVAERGAFEFYKQTLGRGDVWGDGVVPLDCCRLDGARYVEINGVEHLPSPFADWYGSARGVDLWRDCL